MTVQFAESTVPVSKEQSAMEKRDSSWTVQLRVEDDYSVDGLGNVCGRAACRIHLADLGCNFQQRKERGR